MANKLMNQFRFSPVPMVTEFFGRVTIGASGAPTLVAASSLGITSIAKSATGIYLITLQQAYPRLMLIDACFLINGVPAAPTVSIYNDSVASAGTLQILCSSTAGAAANPASGEVMLIQITVKNTQALG